MKGKGSIDAVFINPLPGGEGLNEATVAPPLGLAYLAAVLEKQGYSPSIIDANALRRDSARVIAAIPKTVRLIGFYINSFSYNSVREMAVLCRKAFPEAAVILGGPLASSLPRELLADFPCHGVIRGEGEVSIGRIMDNLARGAPPFDRNVPNAVFRDAHGGDTVMNPMVRIADLDGIPFPAYHLLPPLSVYKTRARKLPAASIVTSRGCPHQCIFCSKDVFQRQITFRGAPNVLAEVDYLVSSYGVRQIDILDDNFSQKRSRVEEILDGLIERDYDLALNLQLGIRTENVDEPLLIKMKKAGVYKLAFGIESADPRVLRNCRKNLDLAKAESVIRAAKRLGFVVYGFFIIGLPGEDEPAFHATLAFARRMNFDIANFCMAMPFVGTELYRMVEKEGRFLVDMRHNLDLGFYGGKVFYEYGDLKAPDVLRRYQLAYRNFYSTGKKLKMILGIRTWPELRWHIEAACSVVRGTMRSRRARVASGAVPAP